MNKKWGMMNLYVKIEQAILCKDRCTVLSNPIQCHVSDPGPRPLCPYLNKITRFYTSLELFTLRLPIPAMSACQSNLNSWLTQNLSKRYFFNMLVDSTLTIMLRRLIHTTILNNNHVLYSLLPPPAIASQNYNLRPRAHNRKLISHYLFKHLLVKCSLITIFNIIHYPSLEIN